MLHFHRCSRAPCPSLAIFSSVAGSDRSSGGVTVTVTAVVGPVVQHMPCAAAASKSRSHHTTVHYCHSCHCHHNPALACPAPAAPPTALLPVPLPPLLQLTSSRFSFPIYRLLLAHPLPWVRDCSPFLPLLSASARLFPSKPLPSQNGVVCLQPVDAALAQATA